MRFGFSLRSTATRGRSTLSLLLAGTALVPLAARWADLAVWNDNLTWSDSL